MRGGANLWGEAMLTSSAWDGINTDRESGKWVSQTKEKSWRVVRRWAAWGTAGGWLDALEVVWLHISNSSFGYRDGSLGSERAAGRRGRSEKTGKQQASRQAGRQAQGERGRRECGRDVSATLAAESHV